MAKKNSGGGKANFYGTYSCFPDPTENQGSSTNKGNVKTARNADKSKTGSGKHDPLMYRGADAYAEVGGPDIDHPKMGQAKPVEIKKSVASFGPADRGYMKGSKK